MNEAYHLDLEALAPRVFYQITDYWLELSRRFVVGDHASREIHDRIAREILEGFEVAGIGVASTTIDIVGFPPVRRAAVSVTDRPGSPPRSPDGRDREVAV